MSSERGRNREADSSSSDDDSVERRPRSTKANESRRDSREERRRRSGSRERRRVRSRSRDRDDDSEADRRRRTSRREVRSRSRSRSNRRRSSSRSPDNNSNSNRNGRDSHQRRSYSPGHKILRQSKSPERRRHRERFEASREGRSSRSSRDGDGDREKSPERRPSAPKNRQQNSSHPSGREVWGNIALEEDLEKANKPVEVPEEEKAKANFGLTGALAKDEKTGNMYNGILLKWSEPLDATQPKKHWRLYVFKGEEIVETLHIHRQSAYLAGREAKVADIVLMHPSCSKQHAVIQHRAVSQEVDGRMVRVAKPYIMDLGSTNKTFLNGQEIEDSRYYELRVKDAIRFGHSSREYILLSDDMIES